MRAQRLRPDEVAALTPGALEGAVLVASALAGGRRVAKGTLLDRETAAALVAAAREGALAGALRLAWRDPDDLHEDAAAEKLALVVGGAGVEALPPRQSRIELAAKWDGVLHVQVAPLLALNALDALEAFTLFHGQAVERGQAVASVKVAPHVVPGALLREAAAIAREHGPLVEVRPYRHLTVPAIVAEAISAPQRERFVTGAGAKLAAMGSRLGEVLEIAAADPDEATAALRDAIAQVAVEREAPLVLVTGVSAGDPLAPFGDALAAHGGRFVRRGLPAHPGSMLWLAALGRTRFLGLPQCGMFSLATAADLVLPRLLTGEELGPAELAELAHGGLLTRDMRFRMPPYARGLEAAPA